MSRPSLLRFDQGCRHHAAARQCDLRTDMMLDPQSDPGPDGFGRHAPPSPRPIILGPSREETSLQSPQTLTTRSTLGARRLAAQQRRELTSRYFGTRSIDRSKSIETGLGTGLIRSTFMRGGRADRQRVAPDLFGQRVGRRYRCRSRLYRE